MPSLHMYENLCCHSHACCRENSGPPCFRTLFQQNKRRAFVALAHPSTPRSFHPPPPSWLNNSFTIFSWKPLATARWPSWSWSTAMAETFAVLFLGGGLSDRRRQQRQQQLQP